MASTESSGNGGSETPDHAVSAAPTEAPGPPGPEPDRDDGSSGALIIAAVLVGMSLLMSAYAVGTALDAGGTLIAAALQKTDFVLKRAVLAAAPPPVVVRAGDPARKLSANTAGSPARGASVPSRPDRRLA